MDVLYSYQNTLLQNNSLRFKRFLYNKIDWQVKMFGIRGLRGVGKSTLLLQYIKENKLNTNGKGLYITMDHPYFYTNNLFDTITDFYNQGGRFVFIDEIHKYPRWANELKVIYDGFPELHTVFTSSSALDIFKGGADLSRRAIIYDLPGLSFREFLNLTLHDNLPVIPWDTLIKSPQAFVSELEIKKPILKQFKEYIQYGYFPIINQIKNAHVLIFINQIINTMIDVDLTLINDYNTSTSRKVKKLTGVIAETVPFKPNIASIARKLDASRDSVYTWLNHLETGKLINSIQTKGKGISRLQKPDKIYLENTNFLYALQNQPEIGTVRETFIYNQLVNSKKKVSLPKSGDFYVDDMVIEVGGKSKKTKQVNHYKKYMIAKDNILTASPKSIPLWLFGFLY